MIISTILIKYDSGVFKHELKIQIYLFKNFFIHDSCTFRVLINQIFVNFIIFILVSLSELDIASKRVQLAELSHSLDVDNTRVNSPYRVKSIIIE